MLGHCHAWHQGCMTFNLIAATSAQKTRASERGAAHTGGLVTASCRSFHRVCPLQDGEAILQVMRTMKWEPSVRDYVVGRGQRVGLMSSSRGTSMYEREPGDGGTSSGGKLMVGAVGGRVRPCRLRLGYPPYQQHQGSRLPFGLLQ